jgi:hypothetical protein
MLCQFKPEVTAAVDAMSAEAILAKPYVIVENAGYVGERDVARFDDYWKALNALNADYDEDERDRLHVAIAYEAPEGRTYEI